MSFLICSHERHKCILTDGSESRARPRRPVTHHIGTRTHLPTLRDARVRVLDNTRHIQHARIHIIDKNWVRATRRGKRRTTPATLFHEHNLHYRAVQPVNSGASRGAHPRPPLPPSWRRRHLNIFNMQRTRSAN